MANVLEKEKFERREKVRELWARGVRSPNKIAVTLNCQHGTVIRDLALLRKQARRSHTTAAKLELIKKDIEAGYLAEIQEADEVIRMAIAEAKILFDAEGKKVETSVNYNAIQRLIRVKLQAYQQLAELHGLVQKEGINLSVSASATAASNSAVNVKGTPDADLIAAGQSVLNRVAKAV